MSRASTRKSGWLTVLACACAACGEARSATNPADGPADAEAALDVGAPDLGPAGLDGGPSEAGRTDLGPPDRPDRDQDGLPDEVDPAPARPNPLLFADTFEAASADWLFSSVAMFISAEEGVLAVRRLEPFEREGWLGPRPTWSDFVAQARLRIPSTGNSSRPEAGQAGLFVRAAQITPNRYVTCGVDAKAERVLLALHVGTRVTELDEAPLPTSSNAWQVLTLTVRGDSYRCEVAGAALTGRSDLLVAGSVGFRTFDATVEADWLRVYDL